MNYGRSNRGDISPPNLGYSRTRHDSKSLIDSPSSMYVRTERDSAMPSITAYRSANVNPCHDISRIRFSSQSPASFPPLQCIPDRYEKASPMPVSRSPVNFTQAPKVEPRSTSGSSTSASFSVEERTAFQSKPTIPIETSERPSGTLQDAFHARRKLAKPPLARSPGASPSSDQEVNPFMSRPKVRVDYDPTPVVEEPAVPRFDFDSIPAVAGRSGREVTIDNTPRELAPCCHCDRKFSTEVINKHESVCAKQKSRPQFNSRMHRLAGLQPGEPLAKKQAPLKAHPADRPIGVKRASWKDKSAQLRAAIGAARATDPHERRKHEEDLARANSAALTRCEFCGRSFNAEAAQRHIPFCKSKALMVPRNPVGSVPLGGTGAAVKLPYLRAAAPARTTVRRATDIVERPSLGRPIISGGQSRASSSFVGRGAFR